MDTHCPQYPMTVETRFDSDHANQMMSPGTTVTPLEFQRTTPEGSQSQSAA